LLTSKTAGEKQAEDFYPLFFSFIEMENLELQRNKEQAEAGEHKSKNRGNKEISVGVKVNKSMPIKSPNKATT